MESNPLSMKDYLAWKEADAVGKGTGVDVIDNLLKQRGSVYGDIRNNTNCQWELKAAILRNYRLHPELFKNRTADEAIRDERAHGECLDYILEKIARIVTGTGLHEDNYRDICGYAELMRKIAMGESTAP